MSDREDRLFCFFGLAESEKSKIVTFNRHRAGY